MSTSAKEEMVTCYGYVCPLASQCKKGTKCTKTCFSATDAEWNVLQHLLHSPYHTLQENEALELIAQQEVRTWEEVAKVAATRRMEEDAWEPQSLRNTLPPAAKRSSAVVPARDDTRLATRPTAKRSSHSRGQPARSPSRSPRGSRGSDDHRQRCLGAPPGRPSVVEDAAPRGPSGVMITANGVVEPTVITLGYQQYVACIDSLQRAAYAAEASQALCQKAARAFEDEAYCLKRCKCILESFMP